MDQSNSSSNRSKAQNDQTDPGGGIKETFESILVAFILAFIFRAFIVEAFVIPTGSMAPTLLGAHMRFRCEDCGYSYTANYSPRGDGDNLIIPSQSTENYEVYCPNCGYKVSTGAGTGEPVIDVDNDAKTPKVHYGDRILVLKYLYLLEDPQRWDVVVFKSPARDTPEKRFQLNFIKRLVGLPGESLMILDGDIYTAGANGVLPTDFTVQPKPRQVQDALWRIIYDNDSPARGIPRRNDPRLGEPAGKWKQPWTPVEGSGWTLTDDQSRPLRTFAFDNAQSSGSLRFNDRANPGQHAFTDWLAYDLTMPNPSEVGIVGDLKLDLYYQRTAGDGALRLRLTKLGKTFITKITPTQISLHHGTPGEPIIGQPIGIKPSSQPMHVEFMNVDYQVSLYIDGQRILQTTPDDYAPDVPRLLRAFDFNERREMPSVEIAAENQTSAISHLSLWRDVYYTNRRLEGKLPHGSPQDFPSNLMRLKADEFFVMGDNTLISGDARYWYDPIDLPEEFLKVDSGRVPGRFMLGKALFVYWPGGYAPIPGLPGLVPNFGEMRFIH